MDKVLFILEILFVPGYLPKHSGDFLVSQNIVSSSRRNLFVGALTALQVFLYAAILTWGVHV